MVEVYQFDCTQRIREAVLEVSWVGLNAFLSVVVWDDVMMVKHLVLSASMDTWFDSSDWNLECTNRMAFSPCDYQDEHNISSPICTGHPS